MCDNEIKVCDRRMSGLDSRLTVQENKVQELTAISVALSERLTTLANAMRLLTRSLWAVAGTAVSLLLELLIRYIQTR